MHSELQSNERGARFAGYPEALANFIGLLEKSARTETGDLMIHFFASILFPDFVCNLSLLSRLPESEKSACVALFTYGLQTGFTPVQLAELSMFIQPYLLAAPAGFSSH